MMKHIPILLLIGFSLSLCNLANKLHGKKSGSGGSDTASSSDSGGAVAERAKPSAAQEAALAGGQEVKWNQQGISFTVPAKWTESSNNDSKTFAWRSPGGFEAANLIVNISLMDESFPTDVSIKAFYDGAKTRAKNGEVDELKWVEIDGLKGVQFRESNPEKPDDFRRLQWMAYRKYAGQVQLVNVMLSTTGKGFGQHQDAMYGVLYSAKIVH
jgi:hypothetical protein